MEFRLVDWNFCSVAPAIEVIANFVVGVRASGIQKQPFRWPSFQSVVSRSCHFETHWEFRGGFTTKRRFGHRTVDALQTPIETHKILLQLTGNLLKHSKDTELPPSRIIDVRLTAWSNTPGDRFPLATRPYSVRFGTTLRFYGEFSLGGESVLTYSSKVVSRFSIPSGFSDRLLVE